MMSNAAHRSVKHDQKSADDRPAADLDPLFQPREIGIAGLAMFLGLSSWVLPERKWLDVAERLAARRLRRSPALDAEELRTIRVVVGERSESWIEQTFRPAWLAHKYHSWMHLLACHRPGGRRPSPELIGREHLDAALDRGRGALLFTANFAYQDVMAKAALAQAGYPLNYLARDTHGFVNSRLGRRLINPIYTRVERQFLDEHLVFSGDRTKKVNGQIKAKLRNNQPVMVLVTPLGRSVSTLPFMHGRIRIATGALNFACETGAPVLPVFSIRNAEGGFETIVGRALRRPRGCARSDMINAMLRDYLPRLERYVAQYPDQFAFPTSSQHGEALIEPWPESPEQAPAAIASPEQELEKTA